MVRKLPVPYSIDDLARTEGIPAAASSAVPDTVFAAGAINTTIGGAQIALNRALIPSSWMMSSTFPCRAQLYLATGGLAAVGASIPPTIHMVLMPGMQAGGPLQGVILSPQFGGENGIVAAGSVRRVLNADGTVAASGVTGTVVYAVVGMSVYDDLNLTADKLIYCSFDSYGNAVGRTKKTACLDWMIRQYYSDKGLNVRLRMDSVSGSTSSDHELFRQRGRWDFDAPALWIYELMVNDAGGSISPATYTENLQKAIAHKKVRWPKTKMIVEGCPPMQIALSESNAVALRAAAASAVAAANDPLIKFTDQGQLGSTYRSNAAYYAENSNLGVHPTDAADAVRWAGLGGYAGYKAFLDANFPTI